MFSSVSHAYSHACILSIPPLLLLLTSEFSTSITAISLSITLSGLLFGAGALPFGKLSDRIGPITVNMIGVAISIVACAGLYFSKDIWVFSCMLILMGIGSSTYHPSAFKLISCMYAPTMGRAFGINGLIGNIGQIGAPVTAGLIAYTWGWRNVFIFLLLLGVVTLALLGSIRSDARDIYSFEEKEKAPFSIGRSLLLILLLTSLAGLAYRGITTMLPTYATLAYNEDTFVASAYVTILLATGGLSQLIAGELNDRFGSYRPLVVMGVACIASVVLMMTESYVLFLIGLVAFGFSYFAVNLYTNSIVGSITPASQRGSYYGITFFTRFGLGFVAAMIVGKITDTYSIDYLFPILIAFLVPFVIAAMLLKRESQ